MTIVNNFFLLKQSEKQALEEAKMKKDITSYGDKLDTDDPVIIEGKLYLDIIRYCSYTMMKYSMFNSSEAFAKALN